MAVNLQNVSELLAQRDDAAIEKLIEVYRPLLKAMADRDLDKHLRCKIDASDIVQDACGDVARNFATIEATNRFQFVCYLTTVLKHKITDVQRKFLRSQKSNMFRERPLSILGNNIDAQSTSPDTNPLDRLLSEENCHRLHVAVERLPVELQRLLRWRFRKGMTYKQIGERLQRSENDVRMLITRCLARVKSDVFPNGWSV